MAAIIESAFKELSKNVSLKSIVTGFFAIIVALFTMISTGQTGKLAMRVVGEVTTETKEIVVEVSNYTMNSVRDEAGYSNYKLEVKNGEDWKEVYILGANKDIAYSSIKPLTSQVYVISLTMPLLNIPTTLSVGDYRLTKTFPDGQTATAEFSVAK